MFPAKYRPEFGSHIKYSTAARACECSSSSDSDLLGPGRDRANITGGKVGFELAADNIHFYAFWLRHS